MSKKMLSRIKQYIIKLFCKGFEYQKTKFISYTINNIHL